MTSHPRVEQVVRYIREQIVTGQVGAGTFLRLERLADETGVSVTPVREALMQLRSQGFVEWHPQRGFAVVPLTGDDIRDIYQVQAYTASELVRRAVRRLSPDDVDELERMQDRLEDAHKRGKVDEVEQHNHEFHRALNTAAGSPRLAYLLRTFTQFAPRLFFARIDGWPQASASDHRAIIEAIRSGEVEDAAIAMSAHVTRAGDLLAEHIDGQQAQGI